MSEAIIVQIKQLLRLHCGRSAARWCPMWTDMPLPCRASVRTR